MINYIDTVSANVNLKDGKTVMDRLLFGVYFNNPISTKELSRFCKLPVPVVTAIKKEFIKLGLFVQKSGISLTDLGKEYLDSIYGFNSLNYEFYEKLLTDGHAAHDLCTSIAEELSDIYADRPQVDVTLDQAKCTVLTSVKRAVMAACNFVLLGKRILCVGDDDLVSIALGFLIKKLYVSENAAKTEIFVLEKDIRYVEYINSLSEKYSLPVKCIQLDLIDPMPIKYTGMFDVFYTDPPYTLDGLSLFLSRGIGGLKKEKGLKIFLSFGQKPNEDVYRMQEVFLAHGLIVTNIDDNFNEYEGASLLGNMNRMITLETTEHLKSVIPITMAGKEKIYTADAKNSQTLYKCRGCKQIIPTGKHETINTVEKLKTTGCPYCGGFIFDLEKAKVIPSPSYGRKSLGEHILADFFGCDKLIIDDPLKVEELMDEAARKINASVVTKSFHRFSPYGISGVIVIKESHLAIHTWPEYQYAAVDLFTCGDSLDLWQAARYIKECLKAGTMETTDIARGILEHGGVEFGKS